MDREQIHALLCDVGAVESDDVAEAVVAALEARDLLRIGERRRWRVTVDDPDAMAAYTFDVDAHTAYAASIEAARRAIRADPGACLAGTVKNLTDAQRAHMADDDADGLVGAVAKWAVAQPIVPVPTAEGADAA